MLRALCCEVCHRHQIAGCVSLISTCSSCGILICICYGFIMFDEQILQTIVFQAQDTTRSLRTLSTKEVITLYCSMMLFVCVCVLSFQLFLIKIVLFSLSSISFILILNCLLHWYILKLLFIFNCMYRVGILWWIK